MSAHTHTERVRPLAPIPQTERQGPFLLPPGRSTACGYNANDGAPVRLLTAILEGLMNKGGSDWCVPPTQSGPFTTTGRPGPIMATASLSLLPNLRACRPILTQPAGSFCDEALDSSPSGRSSSQVVLELAWRCGLSIYLSRPIRVAGRSVFYGSNGLKCFGFALGIKLSTGRSS